MDKVVVNVADQEFEITPLRANKVAKIANLFGNIVLNGNRKLRDLKMTDVQGGGNVVLYALLAVLSEDDLVSLAAILVGCDLQIAKDNFDLLWVTDAFAKQLQVSNLKAVMENFSSIVSQTQE